MQKNGIYKGLVEGFGTEGEGIIKCDGTTAFVPFCLVGERVQFKALKVGGNVAYGKIEKLETTAYCRVNPPCPVFGKCGGCALQHMDYAAQLEFKRGLVKNALLKIGGIDADVEPAVGCDKQYRYRNKLTLPIGVADGKTVCGFYGVRSHRIVPITDCLIQAEWAKKLIASVEKFSAECGVPAYDEVSQKGILRRIAVREIGGKFIFALVVTKRINADFLIKELEKHFKDFTFLINVNASHGNAVFSEEWHICRGNGVFEAEEQGIKYRAGANTFVQVNDDVREKLYAKVLEEADADAVALDLYSGGGLLTAMLANKCAEAYGVEIVEEASRCADGLKEANGLQGKMFNVCGKVEEEISRVLEKTAGRKRIIVCDPPRKGMERSAVKAAATSGADKIILISCNPATLARDLGVLLGTLEERDGALVKTGVSSGDYEIKTVIPFDMFPQTKWCETLVVLSHKKPDGHINIKVEFGEEEGQVSLKEVAKRAEERKPKEKVTYKKMQDYIEQTYGFKVHTAYIAEVKRDLGLPMYDAPNAVEELKRPRAHPIPRMVEAIKDTLK